MFDEELLHHFRQLELVEGGARYEHYAQPPPIVEPPLEHRLRAVVLRKQKAAIKRIQKRNRRNHYKRR